MSEDITLTFPARTRNVRLARTVAAAMAAQADLPIDQLEDVRLAVDEAVSQLVLGSVDEEPITCTFALVDDGLTVTVRGRTRDGEVPSTETFSWTVLTALVDSVDATAQDRVVTLTLRVGRHVAVGA